HPPADHPGPSVLPDGTAIRHRRRRIRRARRVGGRPSMSPSGPSAPTANNSLQIDVRGMPPEDAVNHLVDKAVEMKASDVFFHTNEGNVTISVRHLGMLRLLAEVPVDYGKRCMSHMKAIAGMDVAERRRPLDGRRVFRRESGAVIDLRINT